MSDLAKQIEFLLEIEKLKLVNRFNRVVGGARPENSAEHSWHLAVMALLFCQHPDHKHLDHLKILKMVLIHDIVEIDCGDAFLYDEKRRQENAMTEQQAATRIFGLLPNDEGSELRNLWQEFEDRKTPEALFAASLDALQPLMNYLVSCEANSNEAQLTKTKVLSKKAFIQSVSPTLWEIAVKFIDKSVEKGQYLDC